MSVTQGRLHIFSFPSCIGEDAFEWVGDSNKTPHSLPDITSSNTRYTCEDFPRTLHLTPLGPWRLSRTWRVPRCGGRVPCRGRAHCSGRVVRRGREARRGLGSCSPLASARRTTADGRVHSYLVSSCFVNSAALTPCPLLLPPCPLLLPPCPLLLSPPGSSQPAPQTPRGGGGGHRCAPNFSRLRLGPVAIVWPIFPNVRGARTDPAARFGLTVCPRACSTSTSDSLMS